MSQFTCRFRCLSCLPVFVLSHFFNVSFSVSIFTSRLLRAEESQILFSLKELMKVRWIDSQNGGEKKKR